MNWTETVFIPKRLSCNPVLDFEETELRDAALDGNFSDESSVLRDREVVMKAYFTNLPTRAWLLLVLPVVVIAYPVVRLVVPTVVHAVVPEAVRAVLSVI